ncbi:MAG: antibiotic biosynthesis monooxygenase [Thermodesulfobacteriota bacterium]
MIQNRIADAGVSEYVAWQAKVGKELAQRKGFLDQQVLAPSPPTQTDWIVLQRFETLEDAQSWMQSDDLRRLIREVHRHFVGHEDVYLRTDVPSSRLPISATISCRVAPEDEEAFEAWENRAFEAETKAPGFVGHRLERPVPGIQDHWVIVLTFDSAENLTKWLESPVRAALLEEGKQYNEDLSIRTSSYGFDFWGRAPDAQAPNPLWIFKTNLLVLLVLYPTVYLWGYLVSTPLIDSKGVPFWLSLFVGNLFSTQLLGWFTVSWAFKAFDSWLVPRPSMAKDVVGWAILLVLYALSMAGFAYILTLPPLKFG